MPISLVARGRRWRSISLEYKAEGLRGVIIGLFLFFRCSVRATGATFAKHNI